MYREEDDERVGGIEQFIEVWPNSITLRIPGLHVMRLSDENLDRMFYYPENLYAGMNEEQVRFWHRTIPEIIRVRERKRDLYEDMGFAMY